MNNIVHKMGRCLLYTEEANYECMKMLIVKTKRYLSSEKENVRVHVCFASI